MPRHWLAEIAQTAREGTGGTVAGLIAQALTSFAESDFTRCAELAGQAKLSAPRSARILELLGLCFYHQGRWKEALRELLTYRRLTGAVDQNHVIADTYRATGRPERALEVCGEVSQEATTPQVWVETMIVAAGALADKGEVRKAVAMLVRADLPTDLVESHHLRLWYVMADLLERSARYDESVPLWESIVAEDPEFFDAEQRLKSALQVPHQQSASGLGGE